MKYLDKYLTDEEISRLFRKSDLDNCRVKTAVEMTADQKSRLEEVLQQKFNLAIKPEYVVDPRVISGVRLRIGDLVLDASFKHRLEEVRQDLREENIDWTLLDSPQEEGTDEIPSGRIIRFLHDRLDQIKPGLRLLRVGHVLTISDGVVFVDGLTDCMYNELVLFPNDIYGMVMNLERDQVGVVVLGDYSRISQGDEVVRTGRLLEVPVGKGLISRVVNALGSPIDGKGPIEADGYRPIEQPAADIVSRKPVTVPLATGQMAIDAMVPIGRGQRELIIGDRQTGKTTVAIDTILNQAGQDLICIYVAIGQKESSVRTIVQQLQEHGALDYTIVVAALAGDPTAMQYIAPYAGCSMAEYFMRRGKDVLIVYDDLSKQAVAYRELSLLLKRPPGREAYPGDVFYLHSRLLERAAQLSDEAGGGSLTALPIIETQFGDVSAYIPTNVISITDGQIFLSEDLFHAGQRPAVNAGISVSRVGGDAQIKAMKKIAGSLRIDLAHYRELQSFTQFGADIDEDTGRRLAKGERIMALLKQAPAQPLSFVQQAVILYGVGHDYFNDIEVDDLPHMKAKLLDYLDRDAFRDLRANLAKKDEFSQETEQALRDFLQKFLAHYQANV